MGGASARQPLWWWLAALSLCLLSPCACDGNIGCLFSSSLCVDTVEWCYDDFAFGKCIPVYEEDPEEAALYRYDMSSQQLQWFEEQLQQLASRGYRWEHAYTQCVLQAMLYSMRQGVSPEHINPKICDHFIDPKLNDLSDDDKATENEEIDPDETAYVRFTPNSRLTDSDFANEVYVPPLESEDEADYVIPKVPVVADENEILNLDKTPSDRVRDLIMNAAYEEESPAVLPFEGFRERILAEKAKTDERNLFKKKKSISENDVPNPELLFSEERLGAHLRKYKMPPNTAEYITSNKHPSLLDEQIRSNAWKKYLKSVGDKNFPFNVLEEQYEEITEPRVYIEDNDSSFDDGSGEIDRTSVDGQRLTGLDSNEPRRKAKPSENAQSFVNYWRKTVDLDSNPQPLYAEGGPFQMNDNKGERSELDAEEIQDLLSSEWGFMRRERDDVKKPGPRLDAKVLKTLYNNKSVTVKENGNVHLDNNDYEIDPSFAYVLFKNRDVKSWKEGILMISMIEKMLGLEKNTFTNPRVDANEVTFKVEKNSKGYDAVDVAHHIDDIKLDFEMQTGAKITSAGIGDRSKHPIIKHIEPFDPLTFKNLAGFLAVTLAVVSTSVFVFCLKKYCGYNRRSDKSEVLATAADIDTEATRDYQELCRARMSGKFPGQQAPPHTGDAPQRITSLSKETEVNPASTRSSTSSWSEEPAMTNMDISTGHMVLAYMEDHIRNKDRLEQEWRALCAYEAEPCATTAALKPENANKNRYADVLPYDHSRVALNSLTNHLGSDYINASTITDHDPRNPAYIAAAGPLAHTAPDFWQMVWEQGSVVTVMLTRLTENGQQLCHRYWPEEGSELYHIYEVHLVSEHIWCDDYLVRSFYLKNQRTGETRTVTQFHFLSWPDNGVPSSTKALLEFRRKVNKSYRGRSCPIVVHCSDGAGRTGTYCLIDMVLNRMAKGAKEIDIAATLEHIRDQRARTVATKLQFEFVLMAVAEEVHAILKALPAHLQQLQDKKEKAVNDKDSKHN